MFLPFKIFKHAAKTFYSNTKAGEDGATQFRAAIRSCTSYFKWEQKLVSQVLSTIAVNVFIAWRIFQRQDLIQSDNSFKSMESYMNSLRKVQPMANFMFDTARELISYAATIQIQERKVSEDGTEMRHAPSNQEARGLIQLTLSKQRYRIDFFNSVDGVALRLAVKGHYMGQGTLKHCALCGQYLQGYRGHRTTFKCNECIVYLCMKVPPGFRKSCSHIWHSAKVLKARKIPACVTLRSKEEIRASCSGNGPGNRLDKSPERGTREEIDEEIESGQVVGEMSEETFGRNSRRRSRSSTSSASSTATNSSDGNRSDVNTARKRKRQ